MTVRRLALWAVLVASLMLAAPPAGAAGSHALIQGSGSSWSANAVNQWVADVQPSGLQVVYTASGSAQGRKDFGYRTNDFAVSEIGYQGADPLTGESDTPQGRGYAYLPLVSGGTAFPYQVRVRGQLVRNLRLSGRTLALIFTNQITDWSDPAITADNNGRALPSLPITPVVHSEGSGSTAQFTRYMAQQFPDVWHGFAGQASFTEYYPRKGDAIAQSGSDGVMNFVSSAAANGAIGYDEYSYALGKDYPVAKIQNSAGYFTLPTQYNVAVALTQAVINKDKSSPDYLLQNLDNVYRFGDPRTYALSSYSYMIIPTAADDQKMTTAKRQTLADFLYYSICDGQKEVGPIGYSPLPINLVQAGFEQVGKLKQADGGVDLTARDVSTCRNPTFVAGDPSRNYLAEIAPQPAACDRAGQGPCAEGVGLAGVPGAGGPDPLDPSGGGGSTDPSGSTDNSTAATTADAAGAQELADGVAVDQAAAGGAAEGVVGDVPNQVVPAKAAAASMVLIPLAILLLLAVVFVPGLLTRALDRKPKVEP